jgi:uncharacterized repeat protein (TIGR01451 family)
MSRHNLIMIGVVAGAFAAGPANAQIENTATAQGTHDGAVVESQPATATVETEPAVVTLALEASGTLDVSGGERAEDVDAGDTVTYRLTVANNGNITATGVQPSISVSANETAGAGDTGAFEPESADVEPGTSQEFIVTYALASEDILQTAGLETGLSAAVSVAGSGPEGGVGAETVAAVAIPADAQLAISKSASLSKGENNEGAKAEPGDKITYIYTVTNIGNVAISGVSVTDIHEDTTLISTEAGGAEGGPWSETEVIADTLSVSSDEGGTDGSWDLLGAGGAITFTYVHTVTQAEFEAQ